MIMTFRSAVRHQHEAPLQPFSSCLVWKSLSIVFWLLWFCRSMMMLGLLQRHEHFHSGGCKSAGFSPHSECERSCFHLQVWRPTMIPPAGCLYQQCFSSDLSSSSVCGRPWIQTWAWTESFLGRKQTKICFQQRAEQNQEKKVSVVKKSLNNTNLQDLCLTQQSRARPIWPTFPSFVKLQTRRVRIVKLAASSTFGGGHEVTWQQERC